MSSHCKVVKVLSLLMFVLGLLAIIAGAVFVFAAPAVEGLEGVDDPVGTATALGAVFVVTGVLYLVVAVLFVLAGSGMVYNECKKKKRRHLDEVNRHKIP